MSTAPLDYQTYTTILAQADTLVRKVGRALTRVDALHALRLAYPDDPAYAAAARRYDRQTAQAQVAVTQAAPAPPLRKVAASATPVFDELRLQSDALFRTGQAGST